jgi:hypothetical protein
LQFQREGQPMTVHTPAASLAGSFQLQSVHV